MMVTRHLTRRELPALLILPTLLLTLPALWTGWQFDDYVHRELLLRSPGLSGLAPATMELFSFLSGNPLQTMAQVERGDLAWWTLPEAKQAFWRPLSGLTHWLDYQFWPEQPLLMHLHSQLWLVALVSSAALLYRRLMGLSGAAGLAAVAYAFDDAHGFAAAWLANRNMLCATLFGLLALLAHLRWREHGHRGAALLAMIWLGCALLAGEAAVATLAYMVAYALWGEQGPWRRRIASLLPALSLVALWYLIYRTLGYGAHGTAYIEPFTDPLRFAQALFQRAPLLLLGQWTPLPAELSPFLTPSELLLLWLGALACLAMLTYLFLPLLRHDRLARFWATGMLLSLIPASTALPANRLLFFVGLGAMGLLARFIYAPAAAQPQHGGGVARRLLLTIHLLLGPLTLPVTAYSPALLGGIATELATLPSDPVVQQRDLVVMTAPSPFSLSAIRPLRAAIDQPTPARTLLLSSGPGGAWVERIDTFSLLVRPARGYMLGFDSVLRAPWYPLRPDQPVQLGYVRVSITERSADGRPAAALFRFATPLEDPSRLWFSYQRGRYIPWSPPAPGSQVWVEPFGSLQPSMPKQEH